MTPHIRVIDKRAGRRIADSRGATHTLCGGPMTNRDYSYRTAKRVVALNLAVWPVCQECRTAYLQATTEARKVMGR